MATSQLNSVFQHLRRVVLMHDGAGLSDGQLLDMFIADKDQAAFEALVRRYGTMVLKVCHRVIRNHHDAEDAYQATFLVLARKAKSIKPRDRVANWLHGVAFRTALKAKSLSAKKRMWERQVTDMPEPAAKSQNSSYDLRSVLDLELSRLPEVYRLPILLCDLEGKTIKKAAQQLGWPQGTVAGRLARGRKMLAKRLAPHGLAAASGALLLQNSASACVPPGLAAATVKAAGAYALGKSTATGMISANVAILMEGMVKTMLFTKLKIASAVLMVAVTAGIGGGIFTRATTTAAQSGPEVRTNGKGKQITAALLADEKTAKGNKEPGANQPDAPKTSHDKLRGTWKLVETSYGGKDLPDVESTWSIGKGKIVMTPAFYKTTKSPVARQDATYHFWGDSEDTEPAPNNINVTFQVVSASSDNKEQAMTPMTYRGIYSLVGDTLKLCFRQLVYGKRPTEMPASSAKDNRLFIVVLKRESAAPKTDEEKIQGDWEMFGGEWDGESVDVTKDTFHLCFVGDLMICPEEPSETFFKLDSTKNPKQITITYKSGNVERQFAGIYSLEGDDLKISYPKLRDKGVLPDDFTAPKSSGRQMSILKRMKSVGEPSPKDEEPPANRQDDISNKKADEPPVSDHSWANKLFKERMKDFGDCKPGEQLKHRFQMTNVWKLPLDIKAVQVSCGCVTYSLSKQTLQPKESGYLEISMDSTRFSGPKSASILVNVETKDGVYRSIATLTVRANTPPTEQKDSVISKDIADVGNKSAAVAKTDLDRMQGVWEVVSCEGGKNATWTKPIVFMVDGKRACWQMKDDNLQGGLYLDPTADPKTYDFASHRRTWEGIYSVDGDTLQLCYEMGSDSQGSGAKRPTRLIANEDQILVVLKRIYGPEVFNYRRPDGSKDWPPIIEVLNNKLVQPPPQSAPQPTYVPVQPKGRADDATDKKPQARKPDENTAPKISADKMFPDGLEHDFGQVERGALLTRTFRIVNRRAVPLQIMAVQSSAGFLTGSISKKSLQFNEEGRLTITLNTGRFVGPRTTELFLVVNESGTPKEFKFLIKADSQVPSQLKEKAMFTAEDAKKIEDDLYRQLEGGHFKAANYEIWVKEVKDRRLIGLVFISRDNPGSGDLLAMADEAELKVDVPTGKLVINMTKVAIMSTNGDRVMVDNKSFPVPLPAVEASRP